MVTSPRFPWSAGLAWLGVTLVICASGSARPALAQRARYDTTAGAPSAALLRRLAESADAYRTGAPIFLVASDSFPHPVLGGFRTFDEALAVARRAGPRYHVYETKTERDIATAPMAVLPGCYKNDITTQWVCPGTVGVAAVPLDSVRMVELVIHKLAGDPVRVMVSGDSVSAFIMTLDAFDRFMVPYYVRLLGPERTARMRDQLVAYLSRPVGP